MDPHDQRDHLIERARIGEISGDEADAEAVRLGLGSLSRTPAPEDFRPEAEALWTIPMAVAWIVYLDLDEVREWSAPYREACSHWIWRRHRTGLDGPIYEGWLLEDRSRPTLALLEMGAAWDNREGDHQLQMTVSEAREALWIALREGFFVASGIDLKTGRRVEIPALDWNELVPVQGKGESDEVRFGLLGDGYRDVLVSARAMQGFWKKPKEKLDLMPVVPPEGDGYMPLYCVALWIATEGGALDFDAADESKWRPAFTQLLGAIASDKVRVVGVRSGAREPVPGFHFAGCVVDYPHSLASLENILSETMYLRSYPYVDEEHWHKGFDDALITRHKDHWKQLMVERGDVRQRWPFGAGGEVLADQGTGLPGRPSKAKHLIADELERRATAGEVVDTLAAEAAALLDWLSRTHKTVQRPTVTTIENNIRRDYWRLKPTK